MGVLELEQARKTLLLRRAPWVAWSAGLLLLEGLGSGTRLTRERHEARNKKDTRAEKKARKRDSRSGHRGSSNPAAWVLHYNLVHQDLVIDDRRRHTRSQDGSGSLWQVPFSPRYEGKRVTESKEGLRQPIACSVQVSRREMLVAGYRDEQWRQGRFGKYRDP